METNHANGGSPGLREGKSGIAPPDRSGVNGANGGRLSVEFEVERVDDCGYGIQAKYLKYMGERTKYKAVVRNGSVLAIVTRRYKVVPNERVLEVLRRAGVAEKRVEQTATRLVWIGALPNGFDVRVMNSIDATLALTTTILVHGVPVNRSVIERFDVKQVYRRHFGRLDEASVLTGAIDFAKKFVEEFGQALTSLLSTRVDEVVIKAFADSRLPKKYLNNLSAYMGKPLSELVSSVSKKIWAADIDPKVRQLYLDEFAGILWEVVLSKNP